MELRDLAHDRQAEPGATYSASDARFNTFEAVKNTLQILRLETDPVIPHRKNDLIVEGVAGNRHRAPGWRVFHGITDEVRNRLREAIAIRVDAMQVRIELEFELVPLGQP